ncbi:MAG: hypothetical protein CVV41_22380 [Candidatus Riflebacteria bacterium HGW-Riflebacteria-1]|nr:MAG: hypothetical protein CVV41_22380 [Candidatus Riflebacteria bacterium HGW-Riflebacteria-1]
MVERIESAFKEHYVRTSDQPSPFEYSMTANTEFKYDWTRNGEPVVSAIMEAAEIPEEAASDIQEILADKYYDFEAACLGEETEFSSDSYYIESSTTDEKWQNEWREFERSLKTETRFFSRIASRLLSLAFDDIDKMQTSNGRSLVVDAGPKTSFVSFYRARNFQSDKALKSALANPDKYVGPPPSSFAKAGRMNAHGISVFYGANNPEAALAEVRPPVGSKVVIARFEIIRPIRLLDLTALDLVTTNGSIFDSTYIDRLERTMFLRNLSRRITIPVMPDDEPLVYLATQAIADFLASENTPSLDGILFPSVQTAGGALNAVLFHKASRVESIELPSGTEISANLGSITEEGWEDNYTVYEEVPQKIKNPVNKEPHVFLRIPEAQSNEERPATLKIDLDSVCVHMVKAVNFETHNSSVRRHRFDKCQISSSSYAVTQGFDF